MFVERSTNDKIFAALRSIDYDKYCEIVEGGVYFRYDTEDAEPKENESLYYSFAEDLKERNLRIDDVYIEHDCISGDVVFIEDE